MIDISQQLKRAADYMDQTRTSFAKQSAKAKKHLVDEAGVLVGPVENFPGPTIYWHYGSVSLHILHLVDDFGNQIRPCDLPHGVFSARYNFFKGEWDE